MIEKAVPTKYPELKGTAFFFGAVIAALAVTSLAGAALSWDGSYYLFKMEDTQAPFVDHNRWVWVLLQLPTVLANHLSDNLWFLQTVFGLSYALVPLAALAISWWFVRRSAPQLFTWAAFGIGLGTLPTQVAFVSDATMALQLSWPVFLAILIGLPRWQIPVIGLLCLFILIVHPVGIILLGLAAGLCLLKAVFIKAERSYMLHWLGVFVLLTLLAVLKLELFMTSYDTSQLSVAALQTQFNNAVWGLPLLFTGLSWAAGLAAFGSGFAAKNQRPGLVKALRLLEILLLAGAGVVLVVWASDSHNWAQAIDFRIWALFLGLPFMALAAADFWLNHPQFPENRQLMWRQRLWPLRAIGVIFLAVLLVQSVAWVNLTNDYKSRVLESRFSCVATDTLGEIKDTPLDHWSATAYSLLLSGNPSSRVALPEYGCAQADLGQGLQLAEWDMRAWGSGNLNLEPLRQQILADQQNPPMCRVFMAEGWYNLEQLNGNWWRWNNGNGKLEIFMPQAGDMNLSGLLESLERPNRADIVVNGARQGSVNITWAGFNIFPPVKLSLKAGLNTVEITSQNPASQPSGETRKLAIAFSNLKLTGSSGNTCQLGN